VTNFKSHLPEYLMEAAELGLFMISAGVFTCLFEYPGSPLHRWIADGDLRRFLIGIFILSAHGYVACCRDPWTIFWSPNCKVRQTQPCSR
jgi:hypothetical protein